VGREAAGRSIGTAAPVLSREEASVGASVAMTGVSARVPASMAGAAIFPVSPVMNPNARVMASAGADAALVIPPARV